MIETLLQQAQLTASDLDGLALVIGPGSFTGLRIGAGVAQGLSFGTGVPVFCVSSLAVMAAKAHLAHSCAIVNVCMLAREEEVYAATYKVEAGVPELLGKEQVCPPAQVGFEREGFAAGDGWRVLNSKTPSAVSMLECHSDARVLSMIAAAQWRQGKGVSAALVLPVYLKEQMDYQA